LKVAYFTNYLEHVRKLTIMFILCLHLTIKTSQNWIRADPEVFNLLVRCITSLGDWCPCLETG